MDAVLIPATFLAGLIRESSGSYAEGLLFGVYSEDAGLKQAQDDGSPIPSTETITKRIGALFILVSLFYFSFFQSSPFLFCLLMHISHFSHKRYF